MELKLTSPNIWLYHEAVDFRKSIDGLCVLADTHITGNLTEDIYLFYNRARDKVKILAWHGNGFVLLYKRLERGRFKFTSDENQKASMIDERQLSWLLAGLDWVNMSAWKTLEYDNYY